MKRSTLGQRIRAARTRAGLTQSDIAAHFNIDRTAVTQWESKRENSRTRPDISRLEEIARLTRTPLWWLLSDESDPEQPWPETSEAGAVVLTRNASSWSAHLQSFWESVALVCRERRSDLWDSDIWKPDAPEWLKPITPDIITHRATVQLVTMARPDFTHISHLMAALVAFEASQKEDRSRRKVVLAWRPDRQETGRRDKDLYLESLNSLLHRVEMLGSVLQVQYYEARTQEEAAQYLLQIL